jgi:hypothetical protein
MIRLEAIMIIIFNNPILQSESRDRKEILFVKIYNCFHILTLFFV